MAPSAADRRYRRVVLGIVGLDGHENKSSRAEPRPRTLACGRLRSCAGAPIGPDPDAWIVAEALARRDTAGCGKRS
jgi:hypothetical protein